MSLAFTAFVPVLLLFEWFFGIRCKELFTFLTFGIAVGSILGSCYDLYSTVPFFDTVLHGVSGTVFAALGFAFAKVFFVERGRCRRRFFGTLLFALCFSLAIASVWEIFEYTASALFGFDMMEDTAVNSIRSYLLSGTHTEATVIDNVIKTVIYYGDGEVYVLDGYLDLGLIDTMTDIIVCTAGAALFAVLAILGYFKYPKINALLIPRVVTYGTELTKNEEPVSK